MAGCSIRTLFPLVFVPEDQGGRWRGEYVTALDTAVDTALDWWRDRLGFSPFRAAPTIAAGGLHPRSFYSAGPDTQELIRQELAAYYPELVGEIDTGTVYAVYATLGADPYTCPGNVIGTSAAIQGGPAVLIIQSSGSLDAFLDGNNPLDPNTGSRHAQTGALAHELGHALGLPHPTDPAIQALSVMWSWWTFPACSLSDQERAIARDTATNWLPEAEPA